MASSTPDLRAAAAQQAPPVFPGDALPPLDSTDAQAWLAAIVESSEDAILSKTLSGIITSWNGGAEQLFGYTAAEAVGQPITLIIPEDRHDEERMILQRLRAGERVEHYDTVRRTKHGRLVEVSLTVSPVRDHTGRIVGASKVARDMTLRNQAQAALREADRRKDELLAILAHELRNPLAPIVSAAQLLLMERAPRELVREAGQIINRQARHMARLIDELLDASRINGGKVELRKSPVELGAVIAAAVEMNRPFINRRGHELQLDLPPAPVWFQADPVRLAQVLSNLLNNAAKFSEPHGRIRLAAEAVDDCLVIRVRDSGIGIAPQRLPGILTQYLRSEPGLTRSHGGLGIGLHIASRLVDLHGGSLTAASDGIGCGSEFTLRLPLPPAAAAAPGGPADTVGRAPLPGGRRVLVVDDNRDAAVSISILLRQDGHQVELAHDGPEALDAAQRNVPDVVLLDLGLPRMSGHDVARRLRERFGPQLLLVAVTGWGQERDRRATREAGFDHHLTKPVLIEAVQALLAQ